MPISSDACPKESKLDPTLNLGTIDPTSASTPKAMFPAFQPTNLLSLPISIARVGGLGWNDRAYNHWMPSTIKNNAGASPSYNGYFPLLASNFADIPKVAAYSVGTVGTGTGAQNT